MQPLGDAMLYADLRDADLARKLAALTPVPRYCICVDIVGSTGLKGAGLDVWVTATLEAFACVRISNRLLLIVPLRHKWPPRSRDGRGNSPVRRWVSAPRALT